jgi:hypothetical protein
MKTSSHAFKPVAAAVAAAVALVAIASMPARATVVDEQAQMSAVRDALQVVSPMQNAIADYRRTHDAFPASNVQAGIPAALYANGALKAVAIGPDGTIDVTLTALSGVDDGTIRLVPEFAEQSGGGDVRWTCTSPSYSNIGDLTGGVCEYSKQ